MPFLFFLQIFKTDFKPSNKVYSKLRNLYKLIIRDPNPNPNRDDESPHTNISLHFKPDESDLICNAQFGHVKLQFLIIILGTVRPILSHVRYGLTLGIT